MLAAQILVVIGALLVMMGVLGLSLCDTEPEVKRATKRLAWGVILTVLGLVLAQVVVR